MANDITKTIELPLSSILGESKLLLTNLESRAAYENGKKTENTVMKATVVVPARRYESYEIIVEDLCDFPDDNEAIGLLCAEEKPIEVKLIDATAKLYPNYNGIGSKLSIKAKSIDFAEAPKVKSAPPKQSNGSNDNT